MIFFRETTRHAIAKPVVGCACTKPTAGLGDYVTTVTMMSAEGAKNAWRCLVVSQHSHKGRNQEDLYDGTNIYEREENSATGIVDVTADDVVNVSQFPI